VKIEDLLRMLMVECPGCGQTVPLLYGDRMAVCHDCRMEAHLRWKWMKPVDNNIRSEEDIPLGAEAKCRWCKRPVEWMGEHWRHKGKKSYRHQAAPPENFLQGESDDEEI